MHPPAKAFNSHRKKDNIVLIFHWPVTLFFANNYLTEYRITIDFLRNFF